MDEGTRFDIAVGTDFQKSIMNKTISLFDWRSEVDLDNTDNIGEGDESRKEAELRFFIY